MDKYIRYLTCFKGILKGKYQHIIISPEQCSRSGNDTPMFTKLLESPGFIDRIKCLNFDEAHFIVTTGEFHSLTTKHPIN